MDLVLKICSLGKTPNLILLIVILFLCTCPVNAQLISKSISIEDSETNQGETNTELVFIVFPYPGWYMVSLPVQTEENDVNLLFPAAQNAYLWKTDHYESIDTMEVGRGYWLEIPEPTTAIISGTPITAFNGHYRPGWNLIGSVLDTVDFSNPNDSPDGSIVLPLYRWNLLSQWYDPATNILQSNGHWMAVLQECDLSVGQGSPPLFAKSEQGSLTIQQFNQQFGPEPPPPPFALDIELAPTLQNCTRLMNNYPNPFNSETVINYEIGNMDMTRIIIYNSLGQKIRTLVEQLQGTGSFQALWDGRNDDGQEAVSGVYIYKLITGKYVDTKKMIIIR